jgi:hypothetical protein
MSLVDKVVEFITTELNINISAENKKLIIKKFYPDFKDKFYWSHKIENKLYEGEVSKKEYERIKALSPDLHIYFAETSKYEYDESKLKDLLPFTDDINELKKFYDKGGENCNDYFDLMGYFYDQDKLDYVEEDE